MSDSAAAVGAPVWVVSGLPRSGTSMMMRMLQAGGLPLLCDDTRPADDHNPLGYYELEAVKQTRKDPSWVERAGGKVVKVVSPLLADLPVHHRYRLVFMRRHLDEILASQERMLERSGQPVAGREQMKELLVAHLAEVEAWLAGAAHMEVLYVSYQRILAEPESQIARIAAFLGCPLDTAAMAAAIDPALYRQRHRSG
jgi:hypothetical protein